MPMRCLNCGGLVVAPVVSNFVSSDDVEHVWYCSDCFAVFDNVSSFCAGEERRLYYGIDENGRHRWREYFNEYLATPSENRASFMWHQYRLNLCAPRPRLSGQWKGLDARYMARRI